MCATGCSTLFEDLTRAPLLDMMVFASLHRIVFDRFADSMEKLPQQITAERRASIEQMASVFVTEREATIRELSEAFAVVVVAKRQDCQLADGAVPYKGRPSGCSVSVGDAVSVRRLIGNLHHYLLGEVTFARAIGFEGRNGNIVRSPAIKAG